MKQWRMLMMLGVLMVAGIGSGCAVSKSNIQGFNLISIDQEKQLGDKFAGEIEKQYTLVKDPEVQAYVDSLGKKLLSGAREVKFDYTFKVVQEDSVNAFAVPGGHIYVQSGLLKAADTEDELAGVVAHEINHVVARHATRQLTQQYGYTLLLQLVLGQNPGLLTQLATSLFGKAGSLAYSRGMESQSDFLAVETMHKAGYNPQGIVKFFEKLDKMNHQDPNLLTKFFSSHPLTTDRIKEVKEEIAKLQPRSYSAGSEAAFKKAKEKVR
ncbi:M48 family metallopeptidase [Geobacter sp. DSM 9736]|uniref:M48 family metallopeptidase n=1 Tax=Geobacter sp. DSM 9736 TaxID=1277350 RepID=UPI000B50AF4B|nr:M48 family metallopeptidase [Geobacter sp. DSM 9736]SNB46082.1 Peptidase family M48 [Geobacter sp. DSM 9736]